MQKRNFKRKLVDYIEDSVGSIYTNISLFQTYFELTVSDIRETKICNQSNLICN